MLIDDIKDLGVSHWGRHIEPWVQKQAKAASFKARAFSFDEAASYKIGKFSFECVDLVMENMEFAIPPFETTYIEIDVHAAVEGTRQPSHQIRGTEDWRVGFLIDNGVIIVIANARDRPVGLISPFGYLDTSAFADSFGLWGEDTIAALLLGRAKDAVDKEKLSKVIDRFRVGIFSGPDLPREAIESIMRGSAGEIRYLLTAILFLHMKRGVSIGSVPFERKMSRGKSRVFMEHHVVTINLEGIPEMRRAFEITDRASPRAHEVPSHFAHRYGDTNCEHHWIARENEPTHWDCPLCGRFRYLRKQHMRGDASKGFITKEYSVIAQKETR